MRFGEYKKEKPGILEPDGTRRDCSQLFKDWNSDFFTDEGLKKLIKEDYKSLPKVQEKVRWGSCIARPGKIVCIGLNYRDHAKEIGAKIPTEPVIFLKATNAMVGPYDNIIIPKNSIKTDWEIELGVVIGKECRYLDYENDALNYIAGYTISNDVSEREFQKDRGGQWTKGKSCDTFNPVGPFMITSDELSDVNSLSMKLKVNGDLRQSGNTSNMIFNPCYIVWYLSQFMTLEPSDIISTGTPAGVGMGMNPPTYLKRGDVLELEIEKLGYQRQVCI